MDREVMLLILGGLIGITGAIIGGIAEGVSNYLLEGRREARWRRQRWIDLALNWDGKQSLRRADLRGADLRVVELPRSDLMYADLQKAILLGADLQQADLWGANLQGANLRGAQPPGGRPVGS